MSHGSQQVLKLKTGRDKSLLKRHPWVFSGAIEKMPKFSSGTTVDIVDHKNQFLGRGLWSAKSQICARVLTWNADESIDEHFWRTRIKAAIDYRHGLQNEKRLARSTAWRLISSDADGLPGLICDQYADGLVVQSTTAAMDLHLPKVVSLLETLLQPNWIFERSIDPSRKLEGVPIREGLLHGSMPSSTVEFLENGLKFSADLGVGHKTGFYLDQKANRRLAAELSPGKKVLDVCCYTGGFSLHCLQAGASSVTAIDSSQPALELALRHLNQNNLPLHSYRQIRGDAFETLRDLVKQNEVFDLIILDPPKLIKASSQLQQGARAYQDLNRSAMKMLKPGGQLLSFSCSGHMNLDLFQKVLFAASYEAGREMLIQRFLSQAADHPIALNIPESFYLKGLLLECRL
jgi:23S rRNA (cytosine1962-C5)-methyltransferase